MRSLIAACLVMLGGCADAPDERPAPGGSEQTEDLEFSRRLRLGIEQIRRFLPASARAELDRCATIRPDDPELLFQRARLELLPEGGGPAAAEALLEQALRQRPGSVKTRRLLYELALRKADPTASDHRAAFVEAYGALGLFEAASHAAYLAGEKDPHLRFVEERPGMPLLDEYRALRTALLQLNPDGKYAPGESVPVIERSLRAFPDLAVVRMSYAKMLVLGGIRVGSSDRPDLPPMSSTLIMDMAQSHFERVFDQLDPGSPMALDAFHMLGYVAMLMGDYEESVAHIDVQLAMPHYDQPFRRLLLAKRGLLRLKQERPAEAIDLLVRSLRGIAPESPGAHPARWLLHLAYEAAGTPTDQRLGAFRLRRDLRGEPGSTVFDFLDVAPRLGVDKHDGFGPSAWGDYDGDGDDDLFVTGADSYGALFRNDGERFTDVSRAAGLFRVQSGVSTTFVDYDSDGWSDLYVGRDGWSGPATNSLYRNNADGTFTDVNRSAGIGHPGSSFVCAWSDVDRDGDPDLMVANGIAGSGDTNTLYRNNGDGTFTDVTHAVGLAEPSGTRTIGLAFGDYDSDGWPDLFVSGFAAPNRLYRNRGDGTFEEVAERTGVSGRHSIETGYVAFFADFDNDLDLDILRTSLAPWKDVLAGLSEQFDALPAERRLELLRGSPQLFRNEGDGTFTEYGAAAGFVHPMGVMGGGVADLDNDGYLDVYFATGDPSIERLEPDRFWHNGGDGTFTDVTFSAGLGNVGKGHGVTFVDIDHDGDLEIYAPEGGFVHGDAWPNALYLNRQRSGHHWLHVDLEGRESNRDALDTKVIVRAPGLQVLREVHSGEGFGSSNTPTVEVGLGNAERIDVLELRWPSGRVQRFHDVPVDTRILVREGESWVPWDERDRSTKAR